jgi:membrane protein implicated in regulation of membrane protease activity
MDEECKKLMVWPALALIGFLVLTAVVIALGTGSTNRYEREQRARTSSAQPAAQLIGVAPTT